jgi:general secretion pathway protein H
MAGTLRGARAAAIAAGAPVTVVLDLRQHSLQAGAAPPVLLPATVALSAYALSGAPLGPRRAAIRFAPDGSASAVRIGLADGASRAAVLVDWLTGRIVVLDRAVADAG